MGYSVDSHPSQDAVMRVAPSTNRRYNSSTVVPPVVSLGRQPGRPTAHLKTKPTHPRVRCDDDATADGVVVVA